MKLLILGGTGGTGTQLVTQALAAGHDVTVLARNRSRITTQHPQLRVLEGSVDGSRALTEAMLGQHAVVSALGKGKSFKSENLIEHSVTAIVNGMKQHNIRRLLFTSATTGEVQPSRVAWYVIRVLLGGRAKPGRTARRIPVRIATRANAGTKTGS